MAELIAPNLSLSYGWTPRSGGTPGDSGWGNPVSANFKKLDALLGLSVLSATATSPAVTTDGTRYIVPPTGATGSFVGQGNKVAVRVAGVWEFYSPSRGLLAENQATNTVMKFNGTNWVEVVDLVEPIGVNLIPDSYSWITAQSLPTSSSLPMSPVAVTGSPSGYGFKCTTADATTSRSSMLAPTSGASDRNIFAEPGDYVVSYWAYASVAGHQIRPSLWDGAAKNGATATLTTTRTRYSSVITVTAAAPNVLMFYPNLSGAIGTDVFIDSPMLVKRASPTGSVVPGPFYPGGSAARVSALAQATSLHVNNPGAATLVNGAAFTKIALGTVVEDTRAGWSVANNTYTPPESGMYLVQAMLRPVRVGTDNMPSGTNLKLGFGPTAADGIDVECDTSTDALPFTVGFCKPMRLVAGTPYFIFGNHSAAAPIAFTYAQLKITKIGS